MFDKNAVHPDDIRVKLRGGDDVKIPRTPYNLESAIVALLREVYAINGEESIYRVVNEAAGMMIDDVPLPAGIAYIGKLAQIAINAPQGEMTGSEVANELIEQFVDMDLLDATRDNRGVITIEIAP
jgi:hypothetical protein